MPKRGFVTPSQVKTIMVQKYEGRGKNRKPVDGFMPGAYTLAQKLALERVGVSFPEVNAWSLDHGNTNEPLAIDAFKDRFFFYQFNKPEVSTCNPDNDLFWGTGDLLVNDDELAEFKCPSNPMNHYLNWRDGLQIPLYYDQMQSYMYIYDRKNCYFVSFVAPEFEFPKHMQLAIHEVKRDQERIDQILYRVDQFEQLIRQEVERMQP